MNTEDSSKVQNDCEKLLESLESALKLRQSSPQSSNSSIFQDLFNQLAFTSISFHKKSVKSSIDYTLKSLEKLQFQYHSIPLHKEFIHFFYQIGKSLKSLTKFDLACEYYTQGAKLGKKVSFLDPILVQIHLNLCKLLNKQQKFTEALTAAKEAVSICQDIVVNSKNFSNQHLALLTCKTYYQVAVQEESLNNTENALIWCRKAERILVQNPEMPQKLADSLLKVMKRVTVKKVNKNSLVANVRTSRNFSEYFNEHSKSKAVVGKTKKNTSPRGWAAVRETEKSWERASKGSGQSSRKRIGSEKVRGENEGKEELERVLSLGVKVKSPQAVETVVKRVVGVDVGCQTEELVKVCMQDRVTSTEDLVQSETSKLQKKIANHALVKSAKIDIKLEEFDIKYYLNKDFNKLLIILTNNSKSHDTEIALSSNLPVLDTITQDLHPCLDLENNEIVFKPVSTHILFTAILQKEDFTITLKIQRKDPRGEILVSLSQGKIFSSKIFRISEIFPTVHNSLKPAELLSLCFDIINEELKLNQPLSHELHLVYYNRHSFEGFPYLYVKVCKVVYAETVRYMFQPLNSALQSLIIEAKVLSKLCHIPIELLDLNIEKILKLATLKSSAIVIEQGEVSIVYPVELPISQSPRKNQYLEKSPHLERTPHLEDTAELVEAATKVQAFYKGYLLRKKIEKDEIFFAQVSISGKQIDITFTDSTLNKQLKIEATYMNRTYFLVLKYPIPFKQPFKQSIPDKIKLKYKDLVLKKPISENGYLFRSTLELAQQHINTEIFYGHDEAIVTKEIPKDMYDKIIFRTCIQRNTVMYQISMVLCKSDTNEDILQFFVRNGPLSDNSQKFVIDLETICKKSGLAKTQLEQIGKFVVQNMITFAGKDVSFLNFDDRNTRLEGHLVKLQAFFRGMLIRQKLNKRPKKTILKTFLNSAGRRWLCLFKSDTVDLFFQMVSKTDVFNIKLNLVKIANENPYPTLKLFFKNRILNKLAIQVKDAKIQVTGIEDFQI